jgi:four helix bundle protein
MVEKKFTFEKYDLYQRSVKFANSIYNITKKFPKSEQFGLCSQLKRASMSLSFNLAEGFCNHYKKEKIHYYRIAKGSIHECIPGLTLALTQEFINSEEYKKLYNECFNLSRMISGLIKTIENRV